MTGFIGRMVIGILMVIVLGVVVTMSVFPVAGRLAMVLVFACVLGWQHRQLVIGHRLGDRRGRSKDQIQPRK